MLSEETIEIIKAVAPAVGANAEAITRNFYERLFQENPEFKPFFNQAHQNSGIQPSALAEAVCAYFMHIDHLDVLRPAVERIAQKHCSLGVTPEQYPTIAKHLLRAIKEVMGDAANQQVLDAAAESLQFLAHALIGREQAIYEGQKTAKGGWNGYQTFIVERKVPESDIVTSFYLRPLDGRPLPTFKPGQYITVSIEHPTTPTSPRNYSLSDRTDVEHYRISVKRESTTTNGAPDGLISTYLHDQVQENDCLQIGSPCGSFTIDTVDEGRPIVMLAGGIGVTPLLSMAKTLVHQRIPSPIHFIQAARNSSVHAFGAEVRELQNDRDNVQTHIVYDQPLDDDVAGSKCDRVGLIDVDWIRNSTPWPEADFYFCGPKPFMQSIYAGLCELGVDDARIHFEFFGPRQSCES